MEDLEAEAERRVEPHRDLRFARAARRAEDVLDPDCRLRSHAPHDARDERPVSSVGLDRAARNGPGPRVGIAVDAGQPREGFRRPRHQPGVGLEDPHPAAAVPAEAGVGSRRRINLLRLRGRAGSHVLRGGQDVIRRHLPWTDSGVDLLEQFEHIGLVTVRSLRVAMRVQVEKHDVPDNSGDLDFLNPLVLADDLQYSFRPGDTHAFREVRGHSHRGQIRFAGENPALGVHVGNATAVQFVVFFGVVGETADFDRVFAGGERVDDGLGLRGGLRVKRRLERAVPVILSCHCALRN